MDQRFSEVIRSELQKAFPEDGLIGEEHDPVEGTSGFTWVIDPIDGTSNFLSDRPNWCVVLAGIQNDQTEIGVIFDPCHHDLYVAQKGAGATLNETPLAEPTFTSLAEGATSIGHSRFSPQGGIALPLS